MSRVIKVEEAVYNQLDTLRVGRQTFSDVVDDLLTGRLKILEAIAMLEGVLKYREWQREQQEQPAPTREEVKSLVKEVKL